MAIGKLNLTEFHFVSFNRAVEALIKRNNVVPSSPTLLHGVEKGEVLTAAGKSYTITHEGKERYTAFPKKRDKSRKKRDKSR